MFVINALGFLKQDTRMPWCMDVLYLGVRKDDKDDKRHLSVTKGLHDLFQCPTTMNAGPKWIPPKLRVTRISYRVLVLIAEKSIPRGGAHMGAGRHSWPDRSWCVVGLRDMNVRHPLLGVSNHECRWWVPRRERHRLMQLSLTTLPAFVYDSRPNFVLLVSHVPRRENGHNHCDADHNILDNPFVGRAICDAIMRLWGYVPAENTTHPRRFVQAHNRDRLPRTAWVTTRRLR
jgi:hypothetical protein